MIRLRHFLHPVQSFKALHRRVGNISTWMNAVRQISRMKRGKRDSCWCGGELSEFMLKPEYGICKHCGCYVNRRPPLAGELREFYSFDFYWHTMQKFRGHPTIEERTSFDQNDGRVAHWLSLIDQFSPPGKRVVEVGCAHGVLLRELSCRGFECVGVEVDEATAEWTRKRTGLRVLSGVFPGLDIPECDLFLSFDVIEHSISPDDFLRGAAKALRPGGIAIVQTPIVMRDDIPPFGGMFEKGFDDSQHLFIFSREGVRLLAEQIGLSIIAEDPWRPAQEIVVFRK